MKNFLILLVILTVFFTCKKKEDPPVEPDFADSIVGTYSGTEVKKGNDNWTVEYTKNPKIMTVIKIEKNRIKVNTFDNGLAPEFTLSDGGTHQGNQIITLTPVNVTAHGSSSLLTNKLTINFSYGSGIYIRYYSFQGTKQ
jgi:hypothetical protein